MKILNKIILPLVAVITLSACEPNLREVDYQAFKEEVESLDIEELKDLESITVNGYMKNPDTDEKYTWDNKVFNEGSTSLATSTLVDLAILMICSLCTLDVMIEELDEEEDAKYYIGDCFKIEKDGTSMMWNKDLYLTSLKGDYEGSDCDLTFKYTFVDYDKK